MTVDFRTSSAWRDSAPWSGALGSGTCVIGGWTDVMVAPPLPPGTRALRVVFAYPSSRLATLRHWRDTYEFNALDAAGINVHVVMHEASKWARLVLKGHEMTLACVSRPPDQDSDGLLATLRALCEHGPPPFDQLDAWLLHVRDHVDESYRRSPRG